MFFTKYNLLTSFLAYSPAESLIPKITFNINQCVTDSYLHLPLFDGKSSNSYSNFWEVLGISLLGSWSMKNLSMIVEPTLSPPCQFQFLTTPDNITWSLLIIIIAAGILQGVTEIFVRRVAFWQIL